ncbi:MAG: AMP-binding protein [Myxococcales bacterium]|nr:AMP-binding protein [Myxococcales bacterium]
MAVDLYPTGDPHGVATSKPEHLVDFLRRAALGRNGITVVKPDGGEVTKSYAELLARAHGRATALEEQGVGLGDSVVLVLDNTFDFVETYFGILLLGAAPVPVALPHPMGSQEAYLRNLEHMAWATDARLIVTHSPLVPMFQALEPRISILATRDLWSSRSSSVEPRIDLDAPGLIQCTSGSTHSPKPVVLSHRKLVANIVGTQRRTHVTPQTRTVSWLPLFHDMGIIGPLLGSIHAASSLFLLSPATFLLDPASWWRTISKHRGTLTAAPNFAFAHSLRISEEEIRGFNLSTIECIICGAEPIQSNTIQRFLRHFRETKIQASAFCPAYGLAESCVAVSMVEPGKGIAFHRFDRQALSDSQAPRAIPAEDETKSVEYASLGKAIEGSKISIRSPLGVELPEGTVGEVCVEGASLMEGYLNRPDATEEVLGRGHLRTGDRGFLHNGDLFLVGRIKHMVILRGRNYYAEDIETTLERLPGVHLSVAYGEVNERRGSEELHLVVETRFTDPVARKELEAVITETLGTLFGFSPAQTVLVPTKSIPRTSSGKKRREEAQKLVHRGILGRNLFDTKADAIANQKRSVG